MPGFSALSGNFFLRFGKTNTCLSTSLPGTSLEQTVSNGLSLESTEAACDPPRLGGRKRDMLRADLRLFLVDCNRRLPAEPVLS